MISSDDIGTPLVRHGHFGVGPPFWQYGRRRKSKSPTLLILSKDISPLKKAFALKNHDCIATRVLLVLDILWCRSARHSIGDGNVDYNDTVGKHLVVIVSNQSVRRYRAVIV